MEASSAAAMETAATTTAVRAAAPAAVEATASPAVTAALAECSTGRKSKNRESSKRDEGSNLTKYAHNLTFPSSLVTDFQLQSLRIGCQIKFLAGCRRTRATRGNRQYERCSWSANDQLNTQQSLTPLFSICQSSYEMPGRRR